MKVKIQSRAQLRNGIQQINPGDKMYAHVDYSPGFFYQEGIISGSTITDRRSVKSSSLSAQTTIKNGVNFHPQPSYETKKRAQMLRDEVDSVSVLYDAADDDDDDDDDEQIANV